MKDIVPTKWVWLDAMSASGSVSVSLLLRSENCAADAMLLIMHPEAASNTLMPSHVFTSSSEIVNAGCGSTPGSGESG